MYDPSNDYEKKENSSIPSESSGSADGPVAARTFCVRWNFFPRAGVSTER